MVWGCFTFQGTGRLCPVEGMMNSTKYYKMLTKHMLPTMKNLYLGGTGIFKQELVPCHTSKVMQSFFKSKLHVLDWPSNSPDFNPIENLWAIVMKRLEKGHCSTTTKLIEAIIRI